MFLKNYSTKLMILLVMVCITLLSTILPLGIFNFSYLLQDITLFVVI